MHRDQKVGLAFGILLIGAVAAFFFRNETQTEEAAPELENSADIDDEIRALPRHPEVELDPNIQSLDERTGGGSFDSFFPPLDATGSAPEPLQPFAAQPESGVVPPPISIDSHPGTNESRTLDHDPAATATTGGGPVQFYTVKNGDTLTGLAIRFLGRSSRYHEIFEANRDVLASPDSLRANIRIRIPPKNRSAARPAEPRTPRTTQVQPVTPSTREVAVAPTPRPDSRTTAAPISRSNSVAVDLNRKVVSRNDTMSRAAPPLDLDTTHSVHDTEAVPFASSTPSRETELLGVFSDRVQPNEDIAGPGSSRPRTQPSEQSRFVAYGRSPLGFDGPFAESHELARKTAAPPPPKRIVKQRTIELRDADDLVPIKIPESFEQPTVKRPEPTATAPSNTRQLPGVLKYQVRRGDSLEGIAIRYYGTRKAVQHILNANRERLSNPDRLQAGMTIILP